MGNESKRFTEFISSIRYGHPFLRIVLFASPILLTFTIFFFVWLFPLASASSIHVGLTLIAEILGVLLGSILVIIGFLIDQIHQSETLLSTFFPFYRQQIEKEVDYIINARHQIIQGLLKDKVILNERKLSEKNGIIKKSISALSALSIAMEAEDRDVIWNELDEIGYSEGDIIETTWFESTLTTLTPYRFFNLLIDGLNPDIVNERCSNELIQYTEESETKMMRDGIVSAFHRYKFARAFLKSWILSVTIVFITMTLFIAIFTIFGVSETTFHNPIVLIPIYITLIGFLISIVLLPLSLMKVFSLGVDQ